MTTDKEVIEIARARARRVRSLREALRYSREKFSKKYTQHGITHSALQSWEAIRWNGLTENGARKLITCFREEELEITVEWLMFGIGKDPLEEAIKKGITRIFSKKLPEHSAQDELKQTEINVQKKNVTQNDLILEELKLFHQLNPDCIDAIVADDGLAPYLEPGDYVAGRRYFDNDIDKGLGRICIVQTSSGNTLIRLLKAGDSMGYYTLICPNSESTVTTLVVENIKLFSAAPILWIRKCN